MARKPTGWNPSMPAPKASTDSGGVASESIGRGPGRARHRPQSGHVWLLQAEALDEAGQGVGVAGQAERLGRVRGSAGPGRVPGDHREVVAEPLELPPPGGRPVPDVAVEQDQRRPVGALVGDPEPVDLDRLHGGAPSAWAVG
jgi:hypothetical protein